MMAYIRRATRRPFQVVSVRYGMGATASQDVGIAGSLGTPIATTLAAPAVSGVLAGTALAGLAVPLVGAAFAGIVLGIQALMNSGCGQTCVLTSQAANKATALMAQNLGAYLDLPAPRSKTAQAAYLANFDQIWAWLQQVCGQPGMGNAGVRCIQNQMPGTCPLKVSAFGWQKNPDGSWFYQKNGPSGSGTNCWNYFSGFRSPIADDPTVVDDSQAASASGVSALLGSSSLLPLLAVGAMVAAGVWLS